MNTLMPANPVNHPALLAPATPLLGSKDPRHIVWVNEHAGYVGGCEHYIARTARLFREVGVRNTLLYSVDGILERPFLDSFDAAFPLVDPSRQVQDIDANVGFVHRLEDLRMVRELTESSIPCARFYHDHKLFCLREHKYTVLGKQTCQQRTGFGCYSCLGFVQRSEQWPGVRLKSLSDLEHQQDANLGWDAHVVGSSYMADHLQLHGFDSSRIHVAPLFVTPPTTRAVERAENLVFFAGQLVRGKGIDTLLKAMTTLPDAAVLKIAGEGRQRGQLETLTKELGLTPRVEFLGKLNSAELENWYRLATVVAMPSRTPETFGLSGLEASACGAAVVATEVGGIGEWLQHERNGLLCPPNDPAALATCLRQVLSSADLRQRLGENAVAICRNDFAPLRHLLRLMKLFRNCLQGELP